MLCAPKGFGVTVNLVARTVRDEDTLLPTLLYRILHVVSVRSFEIGKQPVVAALELENERLLLFASTKP